MEKVSILFLMAKDLQKDDYVPIQIELRHLIGENCLSKMDSFINYLRKPENLKGLKLYQANSIEGAPNITKISEFVKDFFKENNVSPDAGIEYRYLYLNSEGMNSPVTIPGFTLRVS